MSTTSNRIRGCASATSMSATSPKIERQGWHALVTMTLNGDVELPANATAKIGQTSLLGSLHIELAPPTDAPPQGRLHDGSLIPLADGGRLPDHRADAGRGVAAAQRRRGRPGPGHHRSVQHRVRRPRTRPAQPDRAARPVRRPPQRPEPTTSSPPPTASTGWSASSPTRSRSSTRRCDTIPDALAVLRDQRDNLADALDQLGKFSALAADSVNQTKDSLVHELKDLGPVLESLANAGPALTRSLSMLRHLSRSRRRTLDQLGARRLRQPDRDHRPDAEPARRRRCSPEPGSRAN